jgi:8-oxo-dGTP pyrophosphatase MutT (NUDIX family)
MAFPITLPQHMLQQLVPKNLGPGPRQGHGQSPSRCPVRGCTTPGCIQHVCRGCGAINRHQFRNCPRTVVRDAQATRASLTVATVSRCPVQGCTTPGCINHVCKWCNAINQHQFSKCPIRAQALVNTCPVQGCVTPGCTRHVCKWCKAINQHLDNNCPIRARALINTCPLKECVTPGCTQHVCKGCKAINQHRFSNCPLRQNVVAPAPIPSRLRVQASAWVPSHSLATAQSSSSVQVPAKSHQSNTMQLISQRSSVNPQRKGDNSSTSCSATIYRMNGNKCEVLCHRRNAGMKNGLQIGGAGGYASYNKSWYDSLVREALEESGIDIRPHIKTGHVLHDGTNNPRHRHVAVSIEVPYNVTLIVPQDTHELDTSYGNLINFHKWTDINAVIAGSEGQVLSHYLSNLIKLKARLRV